MKLKKIATIFIIILFAYRIFAQTNGFAAPELNYGASELNNRGIIGNPSLTLNGSEEIGNYVGNVQYKYVMTEKLPNKLSVNLSLIYNTNVEHRVFNNSDDTTNEGYMINAPEWIIGVNGFAVQTLNFEDGYYLYDKNGIWQNLTGEESPLLIPGYNYTNRISSYLSMVSGKEAYDYIEILMADGTKKVFSNVKLSPSGSPTEKVGTYMCADKNDPGYAIVDYIGQTGNREMWYKPGDGLTYHFVEEDVRYAGYYTGNYTYAFNDKYQKVMYLDMIIAPNGSKLGLGYTASNTYGRKMFSQVSYLPYSPYSGGAHSSIAYGSFSTANINNQQYIDSVELLCGNKSLTCHIADYNLGTAFSDPSIVDRDSTRTFSKIKYISDIVDQNNDRTTFQYSSYCDRYYKKTYTATNNDFSFLLPLKLLTAINYYTNKRTEFVYYDSAFDGSTFPVIDFSNQYIGNTNNISIANRDDQTNYMLKERIKKYLVGGVYYPIWTENYNYTFDQGNDANFLNYAREKGITTTITKTNQLTLPYNSGFPPKTITQIKFTNYKVLYYDSTFAQPASNVQDQYTEITKLASNILTDGAKDSIYKFYYYDIDSSRGLNYCNIGTQLLISVNEYKNSYGRKTTTYNYAQQNINYSPNISPNNRKIITQELLTAPDGLTTNEMFYTNFIAGSKTDTNAYYNISLPDSINTYNSQTNKSSTGFLYFDNGSAEGAGQLKQKTIYDVLSSPIRKKVTNYSYYTGNVDYTGMLENEIFNNGLATNYSYLDLSPDWNNATFQLYGRFAKTDGTELDATNTLSFGLSFADYAQTYYQNQIFNQDTLSNFRCLTSGNNEIFKDENDFIYVMGLDPSNRPTNIVTPGFYITPEYFELSYFDGTIPSSYLVYNDTLGYIIDTTRFSNSTQSSSGKVTKQMFNYDNQQISSFVLNSSNAMELKNSSVYNYLNEDIFDSTGTDITEYYDYDLLGRVIKTHFGDGSYSSASYCSSGGNTINGKAYYELETDSDETSHVKKIYYDLDGKKVAESLGTNSPTIYSYNSINQLITVTSPSGKATTYTYDGFGNIASRTNPDEGTYKYKYDVNGNLRFKIHANDSPLKLIFNTYDPMNRLLSTGITTIASTGFDTLNPDIMHSFESDTSNLVLSNMYDKYSVGGVFPGNQYVSALKNLKGKLAATAFRDNPGNSWGYKLYDYDCLGRIIYCVNKPSPVNYWIVVATEFDNPGNITKEVVNNSSASNKFVYWYSYDAEERLSQLRTNSVDNYSTSTLDATYNYRADDKIDYLWYPETYLHYDYDTHRGWVTNIAEDALSYFSESLSYYNNGDIQTQTIMNDGSGSWSNLATTFTYDGLDRLTNTSVSGNSGYNESFTYDADGNRLTKTRSGITDLYGYISGTNKLSSVQDNAGDNSYYYAYTYDSKGNVTNKNEILMGSNIFIIGSYDRRNLPLSMTTPSGTFNYFYDDQGNRIIKKSSTSTEYYVSDYTGRVLAIYDLAQVNNPVKMVNIYGNGLIGRVNVDSTGYHKFYYLKDHLGNIRQTWNSNNVIVAAQDYYSFGDILRSYNAGTAFEIYKFTGKERDAESNLDYFGARYYESGIGRWLSVDPMAYFHPETTPYAYCFNNAVNLVDLFGMDTSFAYQPPYWEYPNAENAYNLPGVEVIGQWNGSSSSAGAGTPGETSKKAEGGFAEKFNNFAEVAVPFGDAVSQNIALGGSFLGGMISLTGDPLGLAVFEGSNLFAFGMDITTTAATLINLGLNPSNEHFIDFTEHGVTVTLDFGMTPLLRLAGEKWLLKEFKISFPIKSQLFFPAEKIYLK